MNVYQLQIVYTEDFTFIYFLKIFTSDQNLNKWQQVPILLAV